MVCQPVQGYFIPRDLEIDFIVRLYYIFALLFLKSFFFARVPINYE